MESATKYFILAELSRKETHGYELMANLGVRMGKKPSPSQVYPVLKQLKGLGYVEIRTEKNRGAKYYRLTPSGRKMFNLLKKRFELMMRSAMRESIKVCNHCGCEMISGAYKKGNLYFCCKSCAAHSD